MVTTGKKFKPGQLYYFEKFIFFSYNMCKFFAPEMKTMTDLNGERWIFNFKKVVYTYAVYISRLRRARDGFILV